MKNYNIFLGIAMTLAAGLTACSDDNSLGDGGKGAVKQAIELSGNVSNKATVSTTTRAGGSEIGFQAKTQIVMSIKSDKNGSTSSLKAANTTAYVEKQTDNTKVRTAVTFTETEKRYWDDLYGRDALLTVYAAGVEGKTIEEIGTAVTGRANNTLALDANDKIAWNLSAKQSAATYAVEDLLISNNNKKVSDAQDDRLKYQNYAFDKGNLLFKHAMSRVTINLKKGNGFGTDEFKNPVVTYNGFYTSATVNAADGSVTLPTGATTTDITPLALTPMTGYDYTYDALVIPSRNWDNTAEASKLVFTIVTDDNTYTVETDKFNSSSSMTNKLTGEMLAGNQYVFNVTVNKSDIQVTASLFDWITNTTSITPVIVKGTGIGHDFEKTLVTNFDIYRSKEVGKDYGTADTNCKYTKEDGFTMTPQIYWPNHEDAYYFRAIAQLNEDGSIYTGTLPKYSKDADSELNYIDIKTCKTDGTAKVKDGADIIVGAPTESDGTLTGAKKAESGDINFTFKHALSEVYVHLSTTTTGSDMVDLTNAKVEILNSYTEGQIMAGNNSFATLDDDNITDGYSLGTKYTGTEEDPIKLPGGGTATDNVFRGYTIPQNLTNTNGTVKIKVTTADGNSYTIDAKTSDITAWKEGNQYLYNLTLKKSGIELTASLIDWLTGKVVNIGVQL